MVVACGAPLALTAGSGLAFAQSSIPQSVRNILAAPSALLESNPTGGPRLASQVRDVAVADKAGLQVLINLLANANKDQKSAIGAGLGQAARLVVRSDPTYAAEIQRVVAETKDQDAVLAYASAAGDQRIGAGGAGAGSSGAVGG